jgi:hypothetical protein
MYCFCTTYGGMRPGMPLGRKHFRRSRDAPTKGLVTVSCQRSDLYAKEKVLSSQPIRWFKYYLRFRRYPGNTSTEINKLLPAGGPKAFHPLSAT